VGPQRTAEGVTKTPAAEPGATGVARSAARPSRPTPSVRACVLQLPSQRPVCQHQRTMRIDAISTGKNPPHEVNVIVEVPVGGEPIKYEMDKEAGTLVVDRFLYTSMRYPGNYGFIPHTLSDDGDPCDVLIANQRAIVPGAIVAVRPIGVLLMTDEAGGDEKIIAVPVPKLTRRYENVHNYTDLPAITVQQIEHFFVHYKDLETAKWVKVQGWGDAEAARASIVEAMERAKRAGVDKRA
jgi:inorganic pyrophosphatase